MLGDCQGTAKLGYPEKLRIPHDALHLVPELLEEEWYSYATNPDTQLLCLPVQGLLLLASKRAVGRELSKLMVPSRGAV